MSTCSLWRYEGSGPSEQDVLELIFSESMVEGSDEVSGMLLRGGGKFFYMAGRVLM